MTSKGIKQRLKEHEEWVSEEDLKERMAGKRDKMLQEKLDVAEFVVEKVEQVG